MNARWLRVLALLCAGGMFLQGVAIWRLGAADRRTPGGTDKGKQRSNLLDGLLDDLIPSSPARKQFVETKAKAGKGDSVAQNNLGMMYCNGQGVEKDYAEALKWYRKAAEQGSTDAQNNFGAMYDKGQGVEEDDAEAVKWYRKAAEQGNSVAQCNLGAMYRNGEGVEKDDAEAVKWWLKAAEQGHSGAQYNLGVMYATGLGVERIMPKP